MAQPLGSAVREGTSRPVPRIRFVDDQIASAYARLERGDVVGFIDDHRAAGMTVPRNLVISWARKALWRGDLKNGCEALQLVNASPTREDLLACSAAAAEAGDGSTASAAADLAMNEASSKSRRR